MLRQNHKHKLQKVTLILATLKQLFPNPKTELNYTHDYELLFAVIMSAQTTDTQVNKVTDKLFKKYQGLAAFIESDPVELEKDISSIGLYKNKAKNLRLAAQKLVTEFEGRVPRSISDLSSLPGAGRKTANVVQRELFGESEGIAVDTHVLRLAKQLGLTKHTDPKKVEQDLMKTTPREDWGMISIGLILYGRRYWRARQEDAGPLSQILQ